MATRGFRTAAVAAAAAVRRIARRACVVVVTLSISTAAAAAVPRDARADHECAQWEIAKLVNAPFSMSQQSMILQRNGFQVRFRFNQVANTLRGPAEIYADKHVGRDRLLVHGTLVSHANAAGTVVGNYVHFVVTHSNGVQGEYEGRIASLNVDTSSGATHEVNGFTWDRRNPAHKVGWRAPRVWCGRTKPHAPPPPDPNAPR